MCENMETNKWLWQPHKHGPIHLRVSYTDTEGRRKQITRSLRTSDWREARRIRDTDFAPIILDMDKARVQVEVALKVFPELERQLKEDSPVRRSDRTRRKYPELTALLGEWSKELSRENGNYEVAARTQKRYRKICERFVLRTGLHLTLDQVNADHVAAFRDVRLQQGASKKSVDLELTAVRSMFHYAADRYGLGSNPARGVTVRMTRAERNRSRRARSRRPPTHAEADSICTKFPGKHRSYGIEDFQDYAMIARYTGMRQGEIAHIAGADLCLCREDRYADVVLRNSTQHLSPFKGRLKRGSVLCIHVRDTADRKTKTGDERLIPVSDKLLPVVKRRLKSSGGGAFFPFATADSGASFGRTWLKRVKKINSELTMHGFRHYCTSEMENAGVPSSIGHLILGHDPGTVHEGYFHKTLRSLKDAVDRIH